MKNTSIYKFVPSLGLGVTLALSACGPSSTSNSVWDAATSASQQGLKPASSTTAVSIPVLKSNTFESKWGKPKLEINGRGGYRLSYSDPVTPFNRLVIHGSREALPTLSNPPLASFDEMVNGELSMVKRKQSWRSVVISGKTVRYFQETGPGGADGAYYSTEGFSLRGPDGNIGYYRLVVEAGTDESVVRQRFSSVGF